MILCGVCLPSAAGGDDAGALIACMTEREEMLSCGNAELEVTVGQGFGRYVVLSDLPDFRFLTELMRGEAGDGAVVAYAWSGFDCWRIDLRRREGELIRTLFSDGKNVATGDGRLWDRRYLTEYGDEPIHREFEALLWPFYVAASWHLFPATFGRRADYAKLYSMFHRDVEAAGGEKAQRSIQVLASRTTTPWQVPGLPQSFVEDGSASQTSTPRRRQMQTTVERDTIDVSRGCVRLRQELPSVGVEVVYENLEQYEGSVWVPMDCVFRMTNNGVPADTLWMSTLNVLKIGSGAQDSLFTAPTQTGLQKIEWPTRQRDLRTRVVRKRSKNPVSALLDQYDRYLTWLDEFDSWDSVKLAGAIMLCGGVVGVVMLLFARRRAARRGESRNSGQPSA